MVGDGRLKQVEHRIQSSGRRALRFATLLHGYAVALSTLLD